MRAVITYVHHSCFLLELDRRTFLFDYPEAPHLPSGAADVVRKAVAGVDLTVFVSHGHDDHFNKDLARVVAPASRTGFVVSDDVPDMFPEAVPEGALIVEPDETYPYRDMTIQTLMANDLGVAFVIESDGIRVYFGGDLAEWIWPDMAPAAIRFTETFFQEAIDALQRRPVHIAFSNVDHRLDNFGGGIKLLNQVRPAVFVPMHAFGDTAWLASLDLNRQQESTRVFAYRSPGDSAVFELNP